MQRERKVLHSVSGPCPFCGADDMVLVESRPKLEGLSRLNPRLRSQVHTYSRCQSCGAQPRRSA